MIEALEVDETRSGGTAAVFICRPYVDMAACESSDNGQERELNPFIPSYRDLLKIYNTIEAHK
jgi:hypothetical protein